MPEEIDSATKKVSVSDMSFSTIQEPEAQVKTTIQSQKTVDPAAAGFQQTSKKMTTIEPTQQKKTGISKKLMIILGIVALVILIGAAILGFFWDKIF